MSYQLVDSAFIGQLGVQPLAAVGFTIPVYQLVIGIQVGLGIATTAVISRALGANKIVQARRLGALVIGSGFLLILILCLLIWTSQQSILYLLGADEKLYPLVREYWFPWLLSAWLGAMLYFGYSISRSHGNTMLPGMVMVLTSILNIGLDPLFIFVFDLGLAGAAWATICAFGIGCLIVYPQVFFKRWICFKLNSQEISEGLKQLVSIMLPAMMSQFIPPISAMAATAIVAAYGANVIAAWGLGTRLEFFSIIIVLALTMAMPPMIGRYVGSNQIDKIHQLVKLAVGFVAIWQLLVAILWISISGPLGSLLTTDETVANVLQDYLWLVPLSYGALGICMIVVSVSNAMGMSARALVISIIRLLGCYLPALWLGSQIADVNGLFIGAMIGNFVAGIMSWLIYLNSYAKLKSSVITG